MSLAEQFVLLIGQSIFKPDSQIKENQQFSDLEDCDLMIPAE